MENECRDSPNTSLNIGGILGDITGDVVEGEQQVVLRRDGGRQTDLDLVAPCGVCVVMQDGAMVLSFHSYSAVYRLFIKDKYAVKSTYYFLSIMYFYNTTYIFGPNGNINRSHLGSTKHPMFPIFCTSVVMDDYTRVVTAI